MNRVMGRRRRAWPHHLQLMTTGGERGVSPCRQQQKQQQQQQQQKQQQQQQQQQQGNSYNCNHDPNEESDCTEESALSSFDLRLARFQKILLKNRDEKEEDIPQIILGMEIFTRMSFRSSSHRISQEISELWLEMP
jgi:hypothetical protein